MLCKYKIRGAVKASLKADGIAFGDKEKAIKSLSQCCAARACIAVYLELVNDAKPSSKEM